MANDLNQCNFIGRLGNDPEQKSLPSGDAVTNISIACGWKTKDKEGTEWVRVVAFGKLAEIMGQYLRKGSKVFISGGMRTRKWQDQSGQERYSTEIVANNMQMLDSKPDSQGGQGYQNTSNTPQQSGNNGAGYGTGNTQQGQQQQSQEFDTHSSDIPF